MTSWRNESELHDTCSSTPAAGGTTLAVLLVEFFFADPPNVQNIAFVRRSGVSRGIVIALIRAQMLRRIVRRLRPIHKDRLNGLPQQFGVVDVGTRHDHTQRPPVGLDDHTAFGAVFPAICGV
jgi:hypothetical protein